MQKEIKKDKRGNRERNNLVLRIEFLFELRDFALFGGGEVLGVMPAHLFFSSLLFSFLLLQTTASQPAGEESDTEISVNGVC